MHKLKFGIIGCGMIANYHAQAIKSLDNCEIGCVYDTNRELGLSFSDRYNTIFNDDIESMLSDKSIFAVSICVPSGLHREIALRAISYGKHIILEKPMAINVYECDEIIEACKKNSVKLTVISQLRFSDSINLVKDCVDKGELGDIISGDIVMKYNRSTEYYESSSWKGTWRMDGGGALMNQGIHGVDLLQYIMGKVISVYAITKTLVHKIEVEDTAIALVEYDNGSVGVIQAMTSIGNGFPRRLEICGSKGSIILQEDEIISWNVKGKDINIIKDKGNYATFNDPSAMDFNGHKKQIQDFINAIKNGTEPLVNEIEGKKAVEIICAIYKSANTGEKVFI